MFAHFCSLRPFVCIVHPQEFGFQLYFAWSPAGHELSPIDQTKGMKLGLLPLDLNYKVSIYVSKRFQVRRAQFKTGTYFFEWSLS